MIWEIEWGFAARAALRALPWKQAAQIDAAVLRLAHESEGDLIRVPQVHPFGARLYTGPFALFLTLDPYTAKLVVWYIYRR